MISFTKAAVAIALFWAPTALSQDPCLNDQDYEYEDGEKMRSCANIRLKEDRRTALCQKEEVRESCPQTCGICCEDDPDFVFPLKVKKDTEQDCAWITKNENNLATRVENYCGMGDRVGDTSIRNMCPLACDFCQELVEVVPTDAPTTAAPTTAEPTDAPTTAAPTTLAPTTAAPTTAAPTTAAPTTAAPTTAAPTTAAPTTAAPTTAAPTTAAPTTAAPTTAAPTTAAPTTAAPTEAPTTAAPTEEPTTAAPTTAAPTPLCEDDEDYEFELDNLPGEMRGCEWISKNAVQLDARRERYCDDHGESCPVACDSCTCEDDADFEFELTKQPGEMRGCEWISQNEEKIAIRQEAYCGDVAESCPVACGEC